jgi:hypothetical protein
MTSMAHDQTFPYLLLNSPPLVAEKEKAPVKGPFSVTPLAGARCEDGAAQAAVVVVVVVVSQLPSLRSPR